MDPQPAVRKPRRLWVRRARIVTYSLLLLWLLEYFLLQPARITPGDLPDPEPELVSLTDRLRTHVYYLASPELHGRAPGTPGNKEAETYLVNEFTRMGLVSPAPEGQRVQLIRKDIGNNVFSALPPVDPRRDWLLIGAHFDHLGENLGRDHLGANDNASSVAILLETARHLTQAGALKRFNLLFVAFNAEETPYFLTQYMGSHHFYHHIDEVGIDPRKIRLTIIMDLMGTLFWKPLEDTFFVLGAEKSPELEPVVRSVEIPNLEARPLGMSMVENIPGVGRFIFSDYQIFREHNIPYLFLSAGRSPHYHRPGDTAEKLHYPRMARTVRWLARLIQRLDGLEGEWTYQRMRENRLQDYQTFAPLIRQAARWTSRVPQTGIISLFKLKGDLKRIQRMEEKIGTGETLTIQDAAALQLASIRVQCLLGKMGPCFLLPGEPER